MSMSSFDLSLFEWLNRGTVDQVPSRGKVPRQPLHVGFVVVERRDGFSVQHCEGGPQNAVTGPPLDVPRRSR